jgi:ribonuclease P protein component
MSSPSARKNSTAEHPPVSQRFPLSRRLRKKAEFQRVYEEGTRLGSALFAVFCRRLGTQADARVGLAVPRSLGNAVVRNRAKRRLREAVRRHWQDLAGGLEVVIHARKNIVTADWPALEAEVVRIFRTAAKRTDANDSAQKPS